MPETLLSLLAVAAIALSTFGVGRPMLRALAVGEEDPLSVVVWSFALGLVTTGVALMGLGMAGLYYRPVLGVLTMAGCFWGLGEAACLYVGWRDAELLALPSSDQREPSAPWAPPARWISTGMVLLSGLACLGSLVGALAPPTAGDALCYHLELPKEFLAAHGLVHLPYSDNSTFPLLVEMWYLWALTLDGGVAAGLIHWGLGLLLGLATVLLATPVVGRKWAWIAGAIVVLVPGINNQMTAPLNDVGLALLTTLALAAWWRAAVDDESPRWFLVAGLAAGGALGTKYVALLFATAVAVTWDWALWRHAERRRQLVQGAATVAIVAASVGGIWYLRAAWHYGNPVYPFFSRLAGANAPDVLPAVKTPLGRTPLAVAGAPWQVTMHPERFGGRGHQLGAIFLAALPALVVARRLRGIGTLLVIAGVYAAMWYLLRQNVRFLFPLVPVLAVPVTWVWIELRRFPRAPRWVAGTAFLGLILFSAAIPLVRSRDQLAVAFGRESREDYLLRCEPTYAAAMVANHLLRPDANILSQEHRAFYFDRPMTRESIYRRLTGYDRRIIKPADFNRVLREEPPRFTHVLLAESSGAAGVRYEPTLSRLANARLALAADDPADASLVRLIEYRFPDSDGAVRRYRLIMLR
jgi:hypothetical protein